jgi:hypothetical protein
MRTGVKEALTRAALSMSNREHMRQLKRERDAMGYNYMDWQLHPPKREYHGLR